LTYCRVTVTNYTLSFAMPPSRPVPEPSMPTAKAHASMILGEFGQAQAEIVGKAVVLSDGKAGTVENIILFNRCCRKVAGSGRGTDGYCETDPAQHLAQTRSATPRGCRQASIRSGVARTSPFDIQATFRRSISADRSKCICRRIPMRNCRLRTRSSPPV